MPDPSETIFPEVEVFPYRGVPEATIEIEALEFTSICPRTGLPDFGRVVIRYVPDGHALELKTLKYYLLAFRNHGVFYEHGISQILEYLSQRCKPLRMTVEGHFSVRGGVRSNIRTTYEKDLRTDA